MQTKKIFLITLSAILLFTMLLSAQSVTQANDPLIPYAYVPLVSKAISDTVLISPADGAVLNTLVPVFTYKPEPIPAGGFSVLNYDTAPTFDTVKSRTWSIWGAANLEPIHTIEPFENFLPNTTYYWRAGVVLGADKPTPQWGPTWSFTTGANGVLPGAAVLTAPNPDITITQVNTTFSWQAVPVATGYALRLCSDFGGCRIYTTDQTSVNINFERFSPRDYTWYVTARNAYGYGPDSEVRSFTFPGAPNQLQAEGVSEPQPAGEFLQPDGKTYKIYR